MHEADLFIAESHFFDKKIPPHLDLDSLVRGLPLIRPRRLVLTRMSDDMRARVASLPFEAAFDGWVIEPQVRVRRHAPTAQSDQ